MTKGKAQENDGFSLLKRKSKERKSKRASDYSDDDGDSDYDNGNSNNVSDQEVEQAQGRLKEAKKYLESLGRTSKRVKQKEEGEDSEGEESSSLPFGEIDAEEIDREIIAGRLQRDTLISRGRAFEAVAERYTDAEYTKIQCNTPDGRVPTACVFGGGESNVLYMTTKSNCLYQYVLEGGSLKKIHTFRCIGSSSKDIDSFCSLAVSHCGTYLVAGSRSGKIVVWSVKKNNSNSSSTNSMFTYKQISVLTQHRGSVLSISFSRDDLTFYSASSDRTVKIWSVESGEALYIDTLYGHQDTVPSVAALGKDTCVTVGSRDRTARLWKIVEETQLVFRGPEASGGSQDIISMIEEGAFVTGTDLGAISLWNTRRKKPLKTVLNAHSGNSPIGALAAYPFTDLVASGSVDGFLRLWRAAPSANELVCLREIILPGIVNCVAWNENGTALAVVSGKEQRLGRWDVNKAAKNQLHIFFFLPKK